MTAWRPSSAARLAGACSVPWLALSMLGCVPELGPCDPDQARRVVYDDTGAPAYEGQALMIASCGAGGFCHSPSIDVERRYGVPDGLEFDLRLADETQASSDRLATNQSTVLAHRHLIWEQVAGGRMPIRGAAGEEVLSAAPVYSRYDTLTGEATVLPALDTDEGMEILRNWLACRVPVVERTEPRPDAEPIGAVVSPRDVVPLEPRWSDIYARMIVPRCASVACHGRSGAGDLDLGEPAGALGQLVGVPAARDGDCGGAGLLVVPGDPDASLLVQKLTGRDASGDPICGDLMPATGSRIGEPSIEAIRQWIADGANP